MPNVFLFLSDTRCSFHDDRPKHMAASTRAPQFVDTQSETWHYFAYIADSRGKLTDNYHASKPVCKICFNPVQTGGAGASDLTKHLAERHAIPFKQQVSEPKI